MITQQWPQDWKRSVFIPIPKKGNVKECSNYHTIMLISHASKVMLKIIQARLKQYVTPKLPDVKAEFRKSRGTRDQIPTSIALSKKQASSRKISTSALLTMPKSLTVWIITNCGKFLKWWEYQIILPASSEIYADKEATVRTRHGTMVWFQIGKGVRQGCLLSPIYLTYMQSTYTKCQDGWSTSWNQDFWEKYQ